MLDACRFERGHQLGCEVKRGGGRRHRPLLPREHRLIVFGVPLVRRTLAGDIGRQRHASGAFEQHLDGLVPFESQAEAAVFGARIGDRRDALAEVDLIALAQALGVADEGAPAPEPFALV